MVADLPATWTQFDQVRTSSIERQRALVGSYEGHGKKMASTFSSEQGEGMHSSGDLPSAAEDSGMIGGGEGAQQEVLGNEEYGPPSTSLGDLTMMTTPPAVHMLTPLNGWPQQPHTASSVLSGEAGHQEVGALAPPSQQVTAQPDGDTIDQATFARISGHSRPVSTTTTVAQQDAGQTNGPAKGVDMQQLMLNAENEQWALMEMQHKQLEALPRKIVSTCRSYLRH